MHGTHLAIAGNYREPCDEREAEYEGERGGEVWEGGGGGEGAEGVSGFLHLEFPDRPFTWNFLTFAEDFVFLSLGISISRLLRIFR